MTLPAPYILWTAANLKGSVGGKYGAKIHLSTHRRRRILQAAQGLRTTVHGGGDDDCIVLLSYGAINEKGGEY